MVYQYAIKIVEDMKNSIYDSFVEIVSKERRCKIEKYINPMDKWRSLFAEVVLRYALCKHYNLKGNDIVFSYNSYGKPTLKKYQDIHFNVSHSGDWVLCAVGDVSLGVDIEYISNVNLEIAKRFFNDKEYEYFINQTKPNQIRNFFFMDIKRKFYQRSRYGA